MVILNRNINRNRTTLSLFLIFTSLLFIFVFNVKNIFADPPISITSCEDFMKIGVEVEFPLDGSYILTQDLDCTSDGLGMLIAQSEPFTGSFDGQDNTIIIDFQISAYPEIDTGDIGLFGEVVGGSINNLTVDGQIVFLDDETEDSYNFSRVGGLIGSLGDNDDDIVLTNLHSTVDITNNDVDYNIREVGGLIGSLEPSNKYTINNSSANSNIDGVGADAGVFIGYAYDNFEINNSYSSGSITCNNNCGGFIGEIDEGDENSQEINNSYSSASVTCEAGNCGGFIGRTYNVNINNSYSSGSVVCDDNSCGGFGGDFSYTIVLNSYSTGSVNQTNGDYVGGFIGEVSRSYVLYSYSVGSVQSSEEGNHGGFIGSSSLSEIVDSYWDTQTSTLAVSNGGGEGKTTEELKSILSYPQAVFNEYDLDEEKQTRFIRFSFEESFGVDPQFHLSQIKLINNGTDITFDSEDTFIYWANITSNLEVMAGFQNLINNDLFSNSGGFSLYDNDLEQYVSPVDLVVDVGDGNTVSFDEYKFGLYNDYEENPKSWKVYTGVYEGVDPIEGLSLDDFTWTLIDTVSDTTMPYEPNVYSDAPVGWDFENIWTISSSINNGYPSFEWSIVTGCIDSSATNYNPLANTSDDSCVFPTPDPEPAPQHGAVSLAFLISMNQQNQLNNPQPQVPTQPQTPTPQPQTPTEQPPQETPPPVLNRNLSFTRSGDDVLFLQQFLNKNNFTLAQTGPGSPNNETSFFGPLTRNALIRFQLANNITPAIGYFGPITRALVNQMLSN